MTMSGEVKNESDSGAATTRNRADFGSIAPEGNECLKLTDNI
jgi:hypothetical protein